MGSLERILVKWNGHFIRHSGNSTVECAISIRYKFGCHSSQ